MDLKPTGASLILILNLRFSTIFPTGCPFVCLWENPLGVIQNALPTFLDDNQYPTVCQVMNKMNKSVICQKIAKIAYTLRGN
jgi:hypothetical protein